MRSSAFEMAEDRKAFYRLVSALCDTVFEHIVKILFYPYDINQNKWRNEVASKLVEINSPLSKQTNGKFKREVYELLFDHRASNLEEWKLRASSTLSYLQEHEGFEQIDIDEELYEGTYDLYSSIKQAVLPIFLSKAKIAMRRDDFRTVLDSALGE